jgi:hypothetical protein
MVERDLRARWQCSESGQDCAFGEKLASSSEKPIHLHALFSSPMERESLDFFNDLNRRHSQILTPPLRLDR